MVKHTGKTYRAEASPAPPVVPDDVARAPRPTGYQLWKEGRCGGAVIRRFRRTKRGIKFETAEKLGRVVGVIFQTGKD